MPWRPLGDVVVMAPPAGDHAHAVVPDAQPSGPAVALPGMDSFFRIRFPGRRSEPHLVVQPGGHGHGGLRRGPRVLGQFHPDGLEPADPAVPHQFAGEPELPGRPLLASHLEDPAMTADRIAQHPPFGDGEGHGLFQVDVLAGPHGGEGHRNVPVVGGADQAHIDVRPGQELPKIPVGPTAPGPAASPLLAVGLVHCRPGRLGPVGIHVADRHHPAAPEETPHVPGTHPAHADAAHPDLFARRGRPGPAQETARHDPGEGAGAGQAPAEKGTTAGTVGAHDLSHSFAGIRRRGTGKGTRIRPTRGGGQQKTGLTAGPGGWRRTGRRRTGVFQQPRRSGRC